MIGGLVAGMCMRSRTSCRPGEADGVGAGRATAVGMSVGAGVADGVIVVVGCSAGTTTRTVGTSTTAVGSGEIEKML